MRGVDTFTETLFTMRKLEDFVPAEHPLRSIWVMANEVPAKMGMLLSAMYEADAKGGRPSVAPEKLLRATLLHVLARRARGQQRGRVAWRVVAGHGQHVERGVFHRVVHAVGQQPARGIAPILVRQLGGIEAQQVVAAGLQHADEAAML